MAEPKPIFALDLSNDGIVLWHRSGGTGWTEFGQMSLDDPELKSRMSELHGKAVALHGNALRTVVRIPRSEVMLSRLKLGVFEGEAAHSHALKLIADLTPYKLSEVTYDLGSKSVGNMAAVAVVARKTLYEAEEFTKTHGFQPIYFTTQCSTREFPREPKFYLTPPKPSVLPLVSRIAAGVALGLTLGYFGYNMFLAQGDVTEPVAQQTEQPAENEPEVAVADNPPKEIPQETVQPSDLEPMLASFQTTGLAAPSTTPYPEIVISDAGRLALGGFKRLVRATANTSKVPVYDGSSDEHKTDDLIIAEARRDLPDVGINDGVVEIIQSAMSIAELAPALPEAGVVLASLTTPTVTADTLLAEPQPDHGLPPQAATKPADPPEPPPSLVFAEPGTLTPTTEGTLGPENILIFSGRPQIVSRARPVYTPPPDPLAGFRPLPRPEGLAPAELIAESAEEPVTPEPDAEEPAAEPETPVDGALLLALADPALVGFKAPRRPDNLKIIEAPDPQTLLALADPTLSGFRPKNRPGSLKITALPVENPAVLDTTSENTLDSATIFAAAKSILPVKRPAKIAKIAARSGELNTRATAITPDAAKGTAKPAPGPTPTTVAKAATEKGRFNKKIMSLVGVFGTPNDRRALVRLPSGRYVKIKKGDRLSGWKVSAIGESSVRIRKGSKDQVLRMP